MRLDRCLCALAPLVLTACGGDATPSFVDPAPAARTDIRHVVIVVQENHTFDASFGRYCTAAPGSNPTCTAGPACCETVPDHEPGGASPLVLDDARNAAFDPDHHRDCETAEVHGGAMDQFVTGAPCSKPGNFAVATASVMAGYYSLLPQAALADRYFQPEIGQSSANDMYFAIARHAFVDNTVTPMTAGADCNYNISIQRLMGRTVADVLLDAGFTFSVYAEGYAATLAAAAHDAGCPEIPPECPGATGIYPCIYANSDVPFQYYARFADNPTYNRDFAQFARDLRGTLPNVSFIRGYGFHSEHPGSGTRITDGANFVTGIVNAVQASQYASSTLVLVTWDEGGGFFDHISPPATNTVDMQPYGTRVPMIALGRFARRNVVSHVTLEHSSIVRFLEFNYTGMTGQLGARDAVVNNLGSLLDAAQTGVAVPN